MDIGREVRRYRAEPLTSPIPGDAPAPVEQAPSVPTERATTERATADEASRPQEAVEARA